MMREVETRQDVKTEVGAEIVLRAPAKLNVTLGITGRMLNGYHLLNSLMVPITLADRVRISLLNSCSTIEFACTLSAEMSAHVDDCEEYDPDTASAVAGLVRESNLGYRAALAFLDYSQMTGKIGLAIEINKHIPFGAGLGGGSADAAAVLDGLNRLLGLRYSENILCEIGNKLGADVPPQILRRAVMAAGTANRLYEISGDGLDVIQKSAVIIVKPPCSVSTPVAYKALGKKAELPNDTSRTAERLITEHTYRQLDQMGFVIGNEFNTDKIRGKSLTDDCQGCRCGGPDRVGDFSSFVSGLSNDFEEVVCSLNERIRETREKLKTLGAEHLCLTGSGSAFAVYFPSSVEARSFRDKIIKNNAERWFVAEAALIPDALTWAVAKR